MFETADKPLSEMSLTELQKVRLSWLKDILPLAVRACNAAMGNGDETREYGRTFWIVPGVLTIRISKSSVVFDTSISDYRTSWNVQIAHGKEIVTNISLDYIGNNFDKLSEIKDGHFARPGMNGWDWTVKLDAVLSKLEEKERAKKEKQEEDARLELLSLLTTGRLQ
jgi:hypothetical protein